jgi:hypothetical protein
VVDGFYMWEDVEQMQAVRRRKVNLARRLIVFFRTDSQGRAYRDLFLEIYDSEDMEMDDIGLWRFTFDELQDNLISTLMPLVDPHGNTLPIDRWGGLDRANRYLQHGTYYYEWETGP